MSKGFASTQRIALLAGGLFLGFGVLGVRLVWLHVVDRDSYLGTVVKNRHAITPERARRGDILDANNAILATSHSLLVVAVDPNSLRKPGDKLREKDEKKWPQLAALLGVPLPELQKIFTTKFRVSFPADKPAPATTASAASPAAGPAGLVFNLNLPSATEEKKIAVIDDEAPVPSEDADDVELDEPDQPNGARPIRWAKLAENVSES